MKAKLVFLGMALVVLTSFSIGFAQQNKPNSPRVAPRADVKDVIGGALGDDFPTVPANPKPTSDRDRNPEPQSVDLRQGLLAWWNFDFDDDGVFRDSAGKHDLVRYGGATQIGFRGNGWWHLRRWADQREVEYCKIHESDQLNFGRNDFTIAGWFFSVDATGGGGGPLFMLQNNRTDSQFSLRIEGNRPLIILVDDEHSAAQATRVVSRRVVDAQWHHVACCRRQETLELYCDGELVGSAQGKQFGGPITTDLRAFGIDLKLVTKEPRALQTPNVSWQGALDEFCIYSRALNTAELRKLAKGEIGARGQDTRLASSTTNAPQPTQQVGGADNPLPASTTKAPDPIRPAVETTPASLKIAERIPDTSPKLIDLTPYYNAALTGTWHPTTKLSGERANDLAKLPQGVQKLEGTTFDIRGLIQLQHGNPQYWKGKFTTRVEGIAIKQKTEKIHFLQGTGFNTKDGNEIGGYEIVFADKTSVWFPIIYGQDVRDWWAYRFEPLTAERSKIAWMGTNAATEANNVTVRLYRSTWDNPHPDRLVETLNFISLARDSAPFLIAITLE